MIESLVFEVFETREELKAQEVAKRKADLTLPMGVDILLLNLHVGGVPEHAFEHCGDLRTGARLELRIDAHRILLHV
jgi:hypothetical protein